MGGTYKINETNEIILKFEGYLKFKNISKKELSTLWGKSEDYIYRRFSGKVEFSLCDILDLFKILELKKKDIIEIFFSTQIT